MEIKLNDCAQEFFIYAYLGITKDMITDPKNHRKKIIEKCVRRAYLDMCRTLKTRKENTEYDSNQKETDNCSFMSECTKLLTDAFYIDNPIKGRDTAYKKLSPKNEFFSKICEKYLEKNDGEFFYYGQAQKWINMSLKYMWLIGLIEDESQLEAPIDSYIFEAVLNAIKNNPCDNDKDVKKICKSSWSKMSKEDYKLIRDKINNIAKKQNISPIKWESHCMD